MDQTVKFYIAFSKLYDRLSDDNEFTEDIAKDFIAERLQFYKRTNNAELEAFYKALEDNLCNHLLHFLEASFSNRMSAVACEEQDRNFLAIMKNVENEFQAAFSEVGGNNVQAEGHIDQIVTNYLHHQEEIRYRGRELPVRLKRNPMFKKFQLLWRKSDRTNFTWASAKATFIQFAFNYRAGGTNPWKFKEILYQKLAATEHRVLIDDGCMLGELLEGNKPLVQIDEMYIPNVTSMDSVKPVDAEHRGN